MVCQKEDMHSPSGKPYHGRIHIWDRLKGIKPFGHLAQNRGCFITEVMWVNYQVRQLGMRKPGQIYHVYLLRCGMLKKNCWVVFLLDNIGNPMRRGESEQWKWAETRGDELVDYNQDVFCTVQGFTLMIQQEIHNPGKTVNQHSYRAYRLRERLSKKRWAKY